MKKIAYKIGIFFQPYIIVGMILIALAGILLWVSFRLEYKCVIVSSICANIAAGLITGIVVLIISNIKNLGRYSIEMYYKYLNKIQEKISNCLMKGVKTIGDLYTKDGDMYKAVYDYLNSFVAITEAIGVPNKLNKKAIDILGDKEIYTLEEFNKVVSKELEASWFDKEALNASNNSTIAIKWVTKITQLNKMILPLEQFILNQKKRTEMKIGIYNNPLL